MAVEGLRNVVVVVEEVLEEADTAGPQRVAVAVVGAELAVHSVAVAAEAEEKMPPVVLAVSPGVGVVGAGRVSPEARGPRA